MAFEDNERSFKLSSVKSKCAALAKNRNSSSTNYYNCLGIFPDETLTTGFDRLLYFLGVQKKQTHSPSSQCQKLCCGSNASIKSYVCPVKATDSCVSCMQLPDYPTSRDSVMSKRLCSGFTKQETDCGCKHKKSVNIMKRSFSLCSLACRKIKDKILQNCTDQETRWLWTKLRYQNNGCQIYEVFTNSTATTDPMNIDTCEEAKIIFIILPSGIIMPFETLPSH